MAETSQQGALRSVESSQSATARPASAVRRDRMIGIACGILSVLLFSSFTLVSRLGFSSSLTLPDIAALRFGIGGILLLPVLLRYGLGGVRWRDAAGLALFGGLGFALLAYTGFSLAPAAHGAVLLHGTLPLFTFIIISATSRRLGSRSQIMGIVFISAGIALMGYDSVAGANLRQVVGDGFLLLASLFWSTYGIMTRHLGLPPAQGAAIVAVFSMCCFLPAYAIFPGKALFMVGARELFLQAIVQGVLIGAVSIFVYTRAVAALGPTTMTLFTAAVPCVTTLAAVPLLSEFPSIAGASGVGIVTLGLIVGLLAPRAAAR